MKQKPRKKGVPWRSDNLSLERFRISCEYCTFEVSVYESGLQAQHIIHLLVDAMALMKKHQSNCSGRERALQEKQGGSIYE